MIKALVLVGLVTLVPALELRASIPWGIFGTQVSWPLVAAVAVMVNILLGFGVFLVLGPVFTFVRRWAWFERHIWPILERTRHKIHPYVERYGELGVAVFIGIPLPGSGVYTGAFGAYLLGLSRRKFVIANVLGVLIAGAAVTALCLLIDYGTVGADSWLARLFLKDH